MLKGAKKERLVSKIAGGAQMFSLNTSNTMLRIGDRNVEAVMDKLRQLSIPLTARDTGDSYGRTVIFYPETGEYVIRAIGKPQKSI